MLIVCSINSSYLKQDEEGKALVFISLHIICVNSCLLIFCSVDTRCENINTMYILDQYNFMDQGLLNLLDSLHLTSCSFLI